MHLQIEIFCGWFWFCISWALVLLTTLIMSKQGSQFFTFDVVKKRFSIMDLEMASTANEIKNIIGGIYKLPNEESKKTICALRGQLWVDFLFMPAIYGSIFLLCMMVSNKMTYYGKEVFATLAWLQFLPWICDIIENIYLLRKIKPDIEASSDGLHTAYQRLEIVKWGLSLVAAVCALAAMSFFWLSGNYEVESLKYLLILIAEVCLFVILAKVFIKKTKL